MVVIMFISNSEKKQMRESITFLLAETSRLKTEILYLTAKIKALEGVKPTPKKQTTAAQRAKQREYMRAYKARKKAEKLAQATA
jgi:hypothetical protein